jgi:hypothetical protein
MFIQLIMLIRVNFLTLLIMNFLLLSFSLLYQIYQILFDIYLLIIHCILKDLNLLIKIVCMDMMLYHYHNLDLPYFLQIKLYYMIFMAI